MTTSAGWETTQQTNKEVSTVNDLSLEALVALNEVANIVVDINDGKVVRMYIEGGSANE